MRPKLEAESKGFPRQGSLGRQGSGIAAEFGGFGPGSAKQRAGFQIQPVVSGKKRIQGLREGEGKPGSIRRRIAHPPEIGFQLYPIHRTTMAGRAVQPRAIPASKIGSRIACRRVRMDATPGIGHGRIGQ